MSAYSELKTEFKDADLLIAALKEMGYTAQNHTKDPQPLVGYQGDYRTADGHGHTTDASLAMKADIIIPRKQVGSSSNDIGFVKRNGKYFPIISDFDSTRHNAAWLNTLKVKVAEVGILRQAKRAGYRLTSKKVVNGETQFKFLVA